VDAQLAQAWSAHQSVPSHAGQLANWGNKSHHETTTNANGGLEVYEDPIDTDFATYRCIRERTSARIMLDEKARTPQAVLDIVREQAADQTNVHANWAGVSEDIILRISGRRMGAILDT